MVRNCRGHAAFRRSLMSGLAALAAAPAAAWAEAAWNFQPPVTPIAQQQFDLHLYIFWVCVVIFVGVFGILFYALLKHRKSVGHQDISVRWPLIRMAFIAGRRASSRRVNSKPSMPGMSTSQISKAGGVAAAAMVLMAEVESVAVFTVQPCPWRTASTSRSSAGSSSTIRIHREGDDGAGETEETGGSAGFCMEGHGWHHVQAK